VLITPWLLRALHDVADVKAIYMAHLLVGKQLDIAPFGAVQVADFVIP
jgi:hypothetical protein